jgi:hypothetical protein
VISLESFPGIKKRKKKKNHSQAFYQTVGEQYDTEIDYANAPTGAFRVCDFD